MYELSLNSRKAVGIKKSTMYEMWRHVPTSREKNKVKIKGIVKDLHERFTCSMFKLVNCLVTILSIT